MKKYLFILFAALSAHCQQNKSCGTYQDAINSGNAPSKTTAFLVNDNPEKLDYVRDQDYKGMAFCYGHKETGLQGLKDVYALFNLKDAMPEDIYYLYLIGDRKNLCKLEAFEPKDIKAMLLLYIDAENYLRLDRMDLRTGKKDSERVSNGYATVYMYYIFEELKLSNNAFQVGFHSMHVGAEREPKRIHVLNDKFYLASQIEEGEE